MAIRAADPITPFWYTPVSEEGKENPTRFHLKPLDGVEMFGIRSMIKFDDDGQMVTTAACARTALRAGLIGWENFADSAGNPVTFDADRAINVARIPFEFVIELFSAIVNRSVLSETARKN